MSILPSPHGFVPDGGFLPSPSMESPTQTRVSRTQADQYSVTPVTILMLWNTDNTMDDSFRYETHPLSQVTFVGQVIDINDTAPTNVTLKIHDATDAIEVKIWLEFDDVGDRNNFDNISINSYVRVYGTLRKHQGTLSVSAIRVIAIPDGKLDCITFHHLEVIRAHLFRTKGVAKSLPPASASTTQPPRTGSQIFLQSTSSGIGHLGTQQAHTFSSSAMFAQPSRMTMGTAEMNSGVKPMNIPSIGDIEDKIIAQVQKLGRQRNMVEIERILNALSDYPPDTVRLKIESLVSEGWLFFKGTNAVQFLSS